MPRPAIRMKEVSPTSAHDLGCTELCLVSGLAVAVAWPHRAVRGVSVAVASRPYLLPTLRVITPDVAVAIRRVGVLATDVPESLGLEPPFAVLVRPRLPVVGDLLPACIGLVDTLVVVLLHVPDDETVGRGAERRPSAQGMDLDFSVLVIDDRPSDETAEPHHDSPKRTRDDRPDQRAAYAEHDLPEDAAGIRVIE